MNINNFIRKIIVIGLFAAAFSPLIVSSSLYFPFITGKNFFFRIITEVIVFLWLILAVRDKNYLPQKSWLTATLGAFIVVIGVADMFGENPYKSFWSNYERMEGFISLIHLFGYFLVLGSILNTKELWNKFLNFNLGVGLYAAFYGFLQITKLISNMQGGERVDGPLGNPAYFGGYVLFLIAFSLIYLFRNNKVEFYKWIYAGFLFSYPIILIFNSFGANQKTILLYHVVLAALFGILLMIPKSIFMARSSYLFLTFIYLIILYKTATRGAVLGLVGGVLLAVLILIFKTGGNVKKISITALLLLVVAIGSLWFLKQNNIVTSNPTLNRLINISLSERTVASRFLVWNMAYQGFKERPILGWGQEGFNFVFNKHYDPEMWRQEPWFDRAHNVFLDWLISGGIFGLVLYSSLFILVIYYLWFKVSLKDDVSLAEKSIITGLLAAYTFHNFFVFDNLISYLMFLFLLAYVHYLYSNEPLPVANKFYNLVNDNKVFNIWLAFISIFVVFSIYFLNIKPIMASNYIIDGLVGAGNQAGVEALKKAINLKTFGTTEAREQLSQISSCIGRLNVSTVIKNLYFDYAREQMTKQIEQFPNDTRHYVFMANLLANYGDNEGTMNNLLKARELSPKKQDIMFQMVYSYINSKEFEKAFNLAKEAYDLAPEFTRAQMIYGYTAIINDVPEVENEMLKDNQDKWTDQNILNAYITKKRYDKVLEIWKKRAEINPNDPQVRFSLAASYLANNQPQKAIEQLNEAIKIDPNLKKQAEFYISQIRLGKNPVEN